MKYASLLVLTVQNAVLILSMRYSRTLSGSMYITTTAVVISETIKMLTCLTIIFFQKSSFTEYCHHLYDSIVVNWQDTLKMSIPAIVYAFQNNLQYVAVSNLDAAVFQVKKMFYYENIVFTCLHKRDIEKVHKCLYDIKWQR